MVVSQNIPALMIHTNLQRNDRLLKTSVLRLGSGYRINSVKDDPTGLAITNKLTFQITGLNRASENASHGISLVQTAEGALNEVHNMLQRMRELAVYAAHGTLENSDREKIQVEIDELLDEINLISDRTEFNKIKVLSGEASRINDSREMIDVGGGVFEPSASVDKTIAKMLYMSDRTPAKVYEYTIKSVGTPAVCSNFQPIDASLPCPGGIFSINGEQIYIPAGTTFADAQNFMRDACYYHGLDYFAYDDGVDTKACLVSKIAGSNQKIEISGDSGLLAYLGLASGTGASAFVGTDAVLEDISYGLTFLANGNQVSIKGTNGEEINFNLQVLLQRDESDALIAPPVFVFGDGKKIAAAFDAAGALQPAGDVRMMFDIKEYGPIMLQIGPSYNNAMAVHIPKLNAETLGLVEFKGGKMYGLMNYMNYISAGQAIVITDDAIAIVSTVRSRLGAFQNRLEATVRSLDVAAENTETSRSLIRDTDVAKETTAYAQRNVMYQAGLAILAQANMRPQQILSLLG